MKLTCSCGASGEFKDGLAGAIDAGKWQDRHADCSRLRAELAEEQVDRLRELLREFIDEGYSREAAIAALGNGGEA